MVKPEGSKPEVELRPLQKEDANELFRLTVNNKNHLKKFLNWMREDYSMEDTNKFISESLEKECAGKLFLRLISLDNKIVGIVDLHSITTQDKSAEIGYWIDEQEQGKGVATEATKQIINEGFAKLDLNRIEIKCSTQNLRSSAIPNRLGFTREGISRQSTLLEGKFHDMEMWSILRSEWKND